MKDKAARRGLTNVRVFGSIARNEDRPGSDIDLLVMAPPGASTFDLTGFALDVEELTGCPVDVITEGGCSPDSPIWAEAAAL